MSSMGRATLSVQQTRGMKFILCLAIIAALATCGAEAFKSFRIQALTRGMTINDTSPAILGGAAHECYRTCRPGDIRTCYYEFTLVEYLTMSTQCGDCPYTREDCYNLGCITAGGDVRTVSVINHMLSGPSIQVCEGDTVQVNLTNTCGSDSATIHWHGMHQIDTPFMDGVPFLTQCPVQPHNTFLYNFTAYPAGTHMYHSHSAVQEADGLYGSLIVRKANDPLSKYYDFDLPDHRMVIWHWFGTNTAAALKQGMFTSTVVRGYSITINGLAATVAFEQDDVTYYTPRANFTVTQGYRYRFRSTDNSGVYCPVQISVDNHTLLVIAGDGMPIEPVEVDTFIINAGERYDFVITADQEIGNYWIRFRGLGLCSSTEVSSEAILHYEGADDADPPGSVEYDDANRSGVLLSPVEQSDIDYSNNTLITLVELNSTATHADDVSGKPDHVFYVSLTFNSYEEYETPGPYAQVNSTGFEFPPIPLLTQWQEITDDMYCTPEDDSAKDCYDGYCTCPYIYSVDVDSLVEVVFVDLSTSYATDNHPLHLHGHFFQPVAMEYGNGSITVEEVKRLNEAGLIEKKLKGAPVKDSIGVPDHGYAVIRFVASNPGYWFWHCHVTSHADEGMGIVFKVGEHTEMVQAPENFPSCGNYDITDTAAGQPQQTTAPPSSTTTRRSPPFHSPPFSGPRLV